jgi:hypothetical protein
MILVMKKTFVASCLKVFSVVASVFAVVALVVCFGGGNFVQRANAGVTTSTTQTINVTVNEVISLVPNGNFSLPALTPGTAVTSTASVTVTTNAISGWQLEVNRATASTTIASGTIQFPDATATVAAATSSVNIGANLSFREYSGGTTAGDYNSATWGASDADPTALYAGIPVAATIYASTSTYSGSSHTVFMEVRANAPSTQQATAYAGTITITALAQP